MTLFYLLELPHTTDNKEPPVRNSKQNYLQFSDENEHNQSPGGQERRESATKKRISQTGSNSSTTAKSNESPYKQIPGTEREQQIKERASKGQKEPSNLIEVHAFRNSPKLENELDDKLECENYEGKKSGDSFSFTVERRYCTVCNLEQPFRAKHCKLCNRCVCSYDHHCPWLGIDYYQSSIIYSLTSNIRYLYWGEKSLIFLLVSLFPTHRGFMGRNQCKILLLLLRDR